MPCALCARGILIFKEMIQLFIELTNQLYWEGYAEQLAKDNPAVFHRELAEFADCYNL